MSNDRETIYTSKSLFQRHRVNALLFQNSEENSFGIGDTVHPSQFKLSRALSAVS